MNLSSLRLRCKTRWRDPTNAILADADWDIYINDAYNDVLAASPFWPWANSSSSSIVVNAGARTAALPSNVFAVNAVYSITDDLALTPLEGTDRAYRLFPAQDEVGPPDSYRLRGATIEVYPLPQVNTTLKLEFQTVPGDLAADPDVPGFPSQYHRLLILGALKRAYEDDGAQQLATTHQDAFDRLLGQLKDYSFSGSVSRYPGVVDTFYDD